MPNVKYTKELLGPIVARCTTWAAVCRELGVKPMTGAQSHVKKRAIDFDLDYSHFVGNKFNKGRQFGKKPIEVYLVKDSKIKSHTLRLRLIAEGYKLAQCEKCSGTEWMGKPMPLELHHINSDHHDNRIENLQILCPNCHATETRERGGTRQTREV